MNRCIRLIASAAICVATAAVPRSVSAQAFTPPEGVGAVTVAWQFVDNTGHRFSDGSFLPRGQSLTSSALVEVDYGVTDRLSATVGIPYVFAKYSGALPPPSGLPVDACACWHSAFQDFSAAARYRFGDDTWAIAPQVKYDLPSHNYSYVGEAVVGRNLQEIELGLSAALRLVDILPKATVHAGYIYSFVEKAVDDVKIDRSRGFMDFGYALTSRLYVRGGGAWQRTHGGLRAGSPTGIPFPMPGELNTPERRGQRDRVLRTNYWHLSGGVAYSLGPIDLFASFTKYVWGRDTHNGQAYTVGTTWYFDLNQ